jgi:hypothetical protein
MTRQATPVRGPGGMDGIADRRTRRAWNRDTAAVMSPRTWIGMGGYGDARARQLTLALGRVVGA